MNINKPKTWHNYANKNTSLCTLRVPCTARIYKNMFYTGVKLHKYKLAGVLKAGKCIDTIFGIKSQEEKVDVHKNCSLSK